MIARRSRQQPAAAVVSKAQTPLARLATLYGIEPGYSDIWQRRHVTSAATQEALLEVMGVPAGTDAEVRTSLALAEAAAWQNMLPPVIVARPGKPWTTLTLPDGPPVQPAWSIRTEQGATLRGEVELASLEVIGRAVLESTAYQRYRLPIPDLPFGYHRLEVSAGAREPAAAHLIMAPECAFGVADLGAGERLWGITAPLYGLRSESNWGIGDYGDLGQLASMVAGTDAAFVGINPVHAQLPAAPERYSPYAPSSRRFLNVLLIAVEQVPELAASEAARALIAATGFQARLDEARRAKLVDYPAVAALKLQALSAVFESFLARQDSPRWAAFDAFRAQEGPSLERHARFDALFGHFHGRDPAQDRWRLWPEPYRDPDSAEVARFAAAHRDRVAFFAWLQWLAEEQLAQAQRRATAGMPIGLYLDLAIGVDPDGAEAWAHPDSIVAGASLGAPPDEFNAGGQNWGLAPLAPRASREQAYAPLISILRRAMRHAGAVRIDHILGLQRSFWWPRDGVPGAYVQQPLDDLLGIVTLESHRHRCVVVGEDLGTVPDGLRTSLGEAGLLGCSVLYFERERDGAFRPGARYRSSSIASIGTHDLPTLAGWWAGRDIDWREKLGLYQEPGQAERLRLGRVEERKALLRLLAAEGLLPEDVAPDDLPSSIPWQVVEALHRMLARSPALLMALQIEDALGRIEQANLPGTIDRHPNWRQRLDRSVAEIGRARRLKALAATIRNERPRKGQSASQEHDQPSDGGPP